MLMLTDISWATYLTFTGTAVLIWYITIVLLHYYTDIRSFLNGKRRMQVNPVYSEEEIIIPSSIQNPESTVGSEKEIPVLQDFEMIEELVDRVKSTISHACEKEHSKEDFFTDLSKLLKDYPVLLKSQFRASVNEFIAGECIEQGFREITQEEVELLWHH